MRQNEPLQRRAWVQFLWIASVVFLADQASKYLAVQALTQVDMSIDAAGSIAMPSAWQRFWSLAHPKAGEAYPVFASWWHFRYVENPGAAWGFLARSASSWRGPFFLAMSLTAMAFIVQYLRTTTAAQRAVRVALALVFGGAIGNLLDRTRLGYVIDFIDWHIGSAWHWPTFNVADAGITIGVAVLLIDMLREPARRATHAKDGAPLPRMPSDT